MEIRCDCLAYSNKELLFKNINDRVFFVVIRIELNYFVCIDTKFNFVDSLHIKITLVLFSLPYLVYTPQLSSSFE